MSITGTLCVRSLCRFRQCMLLIETTWIFNRYICFQEIEKPQILVLKNHRFETKKHTNLMSNEIANKWKSTNFQADEFMWNHSMSWCGFCCLSICPSVCPSVSLFLVLALKSTFWIRFSWNLHSLSISSIASSLLIFKEIGQSVWEK